MKMLDHWASLFGLRASLRARFMKNPRKNLEYDDDTPSGTKILSHRAAAPGLVGRERRLRPPPLRHVSLVGPCGGQTKFQAIGFPI